MFNIIPQPVSVIFNTDKKGFTLHSGTTISPYPFAKDLISFARKVFNKKIIMHEDTGEERSIILKIDNVVENAFSLLYFHRKSNMMHSRKSERQMERVMVCL